MLKRVLYSVWVLILGIFLLWGFYSGSLVSFINTMENTTFDIRQKIASKSALRHHNKDIVIVAIDDASYEYILDKYGEWPLRRDIYAKMVDYIEQQEPKSIAFDLMFVKSLKSSAKSDEQLINSFKKYDNVFTAMNLDSQPEDLRAAQVLPDKLAVNLTDEFDKSGEYMGYTNCRTILEGIINSTYNIGMINVARSDDGVLRSMPVVLNYMDKYYPQLAVLVAMQYQGVNDRNLEIQKDGTINYAKGVFPANSDGSVVLNWYGPAGTFENIPMYKLLKGSLGEGDFDYNFKDKVVYFGATASSLFDIKTVPVDKVYPGVEVQTTYVNNIVDGSLIKKCPEFVNIIFAILLALLTILCVLKISSMPVAFGCTMTIYAIYILFAYEMMNGRFNSFVWIKVVFPILSAIIAFILAVIVKYIIKSKDFDYQYKLATTDGLTELFNHRYFQEQMQMACANAKRYESLFSLIILDIDFFKKFNDNYGHQSGDAVLKQVASILKKNVRVTDIVCRYGGEEMSIILPSTSFEEAKNIAEKLRVLVEQKTFLLTAGRESSLTISLGVSAYGQDGTDAQDLIAIADKRLYNAKGNGRNRVN